MGGVGKQEEGKKKLFERERDENEGERERERETNCD